jgi:hypothetical protein
MKCILRMRRRKPSVAASPSKSNQKPKYPNTVFRFYLRRKNTPYNETPTKGNTMSEKNITIVDGKKEIVIKPQNRPSRFKKAVKKTAPHLAIGLATGLVCGVIAYIVATNIEDDSVEITITDSGFTVTEVTPKD